VANRVRVNVVRQTKHLPGSFPPGLATLYLKVGELHPTAQDRLKRRNNWQLRVALVCSGCIPRLQIKHVHPPLQPWIEFHRSTRTATSRNLQAKLTPDGPVPTCIAAHQTLVETLLATLVNSADAADLAANWARLEGHFDTLFTTEASVDALKQTILDLAVRGKLVEQDAGDEPAHRTLERLAKIKSDLIKSGHLKRLKSNAPLTTDEHLFAIPAGWRGVRFGEVVDVRDGTHDSPKDATGPNTFPLVTSKDFKDGKIDFSTSRRISAKDHQIISQRSFVERDDILFSMIGGNIGNQVIVKTDEKFSIKNVALFKYFSKEITLPRYVKIYTENLADRLQAEASGGAQPFVSLGYLRGLFFPFPSPTEQHRIVAKVDELIALCDTLKARIAEADETQRHLADAITQRAAA
jgi:type I restriction enzyme, S subunit